MVFVSGCGVEDLEVFDVETGVCAEDQFDAVVILHLGQQSFVLAAEAFENARVDEDSQVQFSPFRLASPAQNTGEAPLNFDTHATGVPKDAKP